MRWHDIFARFMTSLPNLVVFKFGLSSQWDLDTKSRYEDGDGQALPKMPWRAEAQMRNAICKERYVHYDDWEPQWYGCGEWEMKDGSEWKDEWKAGMELPPDCKEEDETALEALLNVIARRG